MSWVLIRKRPNWVGVAVWPFEQELEYFAQYPQPNYEFDIRKAVRFDTRQNAIDVRNGLGILRYQGYVARELPDWMS